jgi:hypothetical protein
MLHMAGMPGCMAAGGAAGYLELGAGSEFDPAPSSQTVRRRRLRLYCILVGTVDNTAAEE